MLISKIVDEPQHFSNFLDWQSTSHKIHGEQVGVQVLPVFL